MQRNLGAQQVENWRTNGDISDHAARRQDPVNIELDVVIVGAGLSGIYLLHLLSKGRLECQNRRSWPRPGWRLALELLSGKDVIYGETITKATFDESTNKWTVESDNKSTFTARFFCSCIGFASKRLFPDWPGLEDDYKGQVLHASFWPDRGIDLRGKKVAVAGTGATGIQLAQEIAREAGKLTCFVRTPNLTWPMRLERIDPEQAQKDKGSLPYLLGEKRYTTIAGFLYDDTTRRVFDDTSEEREARLEQEYRDGGYRIFFSAYFDILLDQAANDEIYNFWRRKVHARMTDSQKAEILAPLKAPHPFGGKRPSLEQDYYEQMDKPHVTLVDVKSTPVTHLVSNGIVTTDGAVHEADVLILATGYDAVTGGFKDMAITGLNGLTLAEKWSDGTQAYLGLTISGFPNFFYAYGPFAPTAYSAGPAAIESQADWILEVMRKMRAEGATRIDATQEAEREWREKVLAIHAMTLRENVEGSWYLGLNVPGKKREPLNYAGGLSMYRKEIQDAIAPDWKGFVVS
ncbi:predicted protein [Uncinocarpus reesii 1704]|uniref:FAD/NAD(P)-binding domain-containing protein n=1 Tax=Uncinocarpus reesii (strain UAMH 1704) TaxID=336963 RepID=C4JV25_UNCRE|nr:uncharacterized protein UREG_04978 [Uncinocarpus reesii 1704]EEP80136.1 predicted protein [Uncinocarpus reesii 1704]